MSFSVRVADGDGVVARFGGSLVVAPSDSTLVDDVIALAREAEREHGAEPGRFLPRRVAGLVSASTDAETLAVVCTLSDGIAVLLVGDVSLTRVDAAGSSTVSGRDATTWVDTIVRGEWTTLTVSLPSAGAISHRSDLQGGVLTGSGVELRQSDGVQDPLPVEPQPVAPQPVGPLPVEPAPTELVAQVPAEPVRFALSLDDGSVVSVDGELVIGREPETTDAVRSGAARPLVLEDPELTMSRVHATVEVRDGLVRLVDAGSANGTYTALPGDQEWTRVGSGETVPLVPGTKVSLGGRSFVLDHHA